MWDGYNQMINPKQNNQSVDCECMCDYCFYNCWGKCKKGHTTDRRDGKTI